MWALVNTEHDWLLGDIDNTFLFALFIPSWVSLRPVRAIWVGYIVKEMGKRRLVSLTISSLTNVDQSLISL